MSHESLSTLESAEYNRCRLAPAHGDPHHYLHLSDLRLALDAFKTETQITVLDFGCGGSPYRALFPNADYRRADVVDVANLDYAIDAEPRHGATGKFDLILSTQVLEHIPDPAAYLNDCHRLLKKVACFFAPHTGFFRITALPMIFTAGRR